MASENLFKLQQLKIFKPSTPRSTGVCRCFPAETDTATFYIGTNDTAELTNIRRHILAHFSDPPVQGEYLRRVAFDIAEKYGKDTFLAIHYHGTGRMPTLFAIKGRLSVGTGGVSDCMLGSTARDTSGSNPSRSATN